MHPSPLSIVVVSHFGGDLLARCVSSLRDQLEEADQLEVLLSAAPGEAQTEGLNVELVQLGENVGYARAANRGFARAKHPLILLLNDDTEAEPGFLNALRVLRDKVGLHQPRILLADGSGRLDNVGHDLFPDGFNWARGRGNLDCVHTEEVEEIGACSGAAMLIHREVLDTIGPFDGDLEAFGEDVDFSLRARRAGFGIHTVPDARIRHHLGASYGRFTPRKLYLVERNRLRAAVRSMPLSALLTMPAWTGLRLAGLSIASLSGRGYAAGVNGSAALAAAKGLLAGMAYIPDAWGKRKQDAPSWTCSETAMWAALFRHRIRFQDVIR
jgi:GT2 family glycosyltransferase